MRPNHDQYFLEMLELVAARSTCCRRSVGAILVDERNRILATGYNGTPQNFGHCTKESPCPGGSDSAGDTSRCLAVHAEVNAILQCHRMDLIHTLYVSCTPCFSCAKMLANTSLKRIVCREEYADVFGSQLLRAQGIIVTVLTK